jgi:hypothetical protein
MELVWWLMPIILARGRDWENHSLRPAQAKSLEDPILTNKMLVMVLCTYHSSYAGSINRRTAVQASPGINAGLYEVWLKW